MAIEGLSRTLGVTVLHSIPLLKCESFSREPLCALSSRQIEHFRTRLEDTVVHPVDQEILHVVHAVHTGLAQHEEYAAILAQVESLGDAYQQVDGAFQEMKRLWRPIDSISIPDAVRRDRPSIVAGQDKTDPEQVTWDARWEAERWWTYSDEPNMAHHFWRPDPQDTLLVIGSFQAYQLLSPNTRLAVRIDQDARQIMHDAVFGGLFLVSDSPGEHIENFLKLTSPPTRLPIAQSLSEAISTAEIQHRFPQGRTQFFAELFSRTGSLSLFALEAAYRDAFIRLRTGEELDETEASNLDWIRDNDQYRIVRDTYREGRMTSLQGNVFDPQSAMTVKGELSRRQARINSFYLSDPLDMVMMRGYQDAGAYLQGLGGVLRALSFEENGRVLWTHIRGIRRVKEESGRLREDFIEGSLVPTDPLDWYAYVEMPIERARDWLAPREPTGEEGLRYFYRLSQMVDISGVFEQGLLRFSGDSQRGMDFHATNQQVPWGDRKAAFNRRLGDLRYRRRG